MPEDLGRPRGNGPSESYGGLLANPALILIALAAVAWLSIRRPVAKDVVPVVGPSLDPVKALDPVPSPLLATSESAAPANPEPPPSPPPPPQPDPVAVGEAEGGVDAASRDRERAEARRADAARKLADAAAQAAAEAVAAKALASRVRDPSARIAAASSRGNFLKADRDRLKGEVAALARIPRPQAKTLSHKNPVARPPDGEEFHFELTRGRVAFIDLDRLLELVKKDAQLRIRMADGMGTIGSRVGPVGSFSLDYALTRSIALGLEGLMDGRGSLAYNMRGWEVVPEFAGRGETFETTRSPISEFSRVVSRLNPARESITLWVYPDSFDLYRKLRDDLNARGFLVAARPLPEGMAIRGSPSGSLSAGQ
ncbi:MAG: hypothetical protein AB7I30_14040 [Isosphaeraceae bacterium]